MRTEHPRSPTDSHGTTTGSGTTTATNDSDAVVLEGPVQVEDGDDLQTAVDVAAEGATVEVGDGTYGFVTAKTQDLTVEGPNAGTPGADTRDKEAIVEGGVTVDASGVTVDGMRIENDGRDGVRLKNPDDDIKIQNSVITDITGGTKAAGNGVQIWLDKPINKGAENIRILNNKISNISTSNDNGDTLAIGVNVLPRGNDVEGLNISGNSFTGIEPGPSNKLKRARGVSIDTQLDGENATGSVDGVVIEDNEFDGLTGDIVRAVALFETTETANPVGPKNFRIMRNGFYNLDGKVGAAAVNVGLYEELGSSHAVTMNNIEDGAVLRTAGERDSFSVSEADSLNAARNWWGDTTGPGGDGPGDGQPVLTNDTVTQQPKITAELVDFEPWLDGKVGENPSPVTGERDEERTKRRNLGRDEVEDTPPAGDEPVNRGVGRGENKRGSGSCDAYVLVASPSDSR